MKVAILILALLSCIVFGAEIHGDDSMHATDYSEDHYTGIEAPEEGLAEAEDIDEHLRIVDANGDGIVSHQEHSYFFKNYVIQDQTEEWEEYINESYNHLDQNQDGELTTLEFREFFQSHPDA